MTAGSDGDVRIFNTQCFEDDDSDDYRLGESVHALVATVGDAWRQLIFSVIEKKHYLLLSPY